MSNDVDRCGNVVDEATVPLDTLQQLLDWNENSVNRCLVGQPLNDAVGHPNDRNRPRTLVCHDMAGGYLEDRFAHGSVAETTFYLREWPYMDIFVYFSHHFVTIPPVGWINAAHLHGVSVLGTIITEFESGQQICHELLSDRTKLTTTVEKLARIAVAYNFDGWLVNIENRVTEVANLVSFVGLLAAKCKEILGPNAMVLWYDSVTVNGALDWQSALNDQNKCYFDVCDGIYLDYKWKEEHLNNSITNAGDRKLDVYVGIDVFGRGCMGDGGFNCNIALQFIRERGMSTAIFAPGWVYEHETMEKRDFEVNQYKFWNLLAPGLYCNKMTRLPFSTTFGPGKRWYPPKVHPERSIVERCFVSLRDQELQPHWFCPPRNGSWSSITGDLTVTTRNSVAQFQHDYNPEHGAILKAITKKDSRLRLFCCHVVPRRPIRVSIVFQSKSRNAQIGLALSFRSNGDQPFVYVVPNTLDVDRTRTMFKNAQTVEFHPAITSSINPDTEMMLADLPMVNATLTEIDFVILRSNDNIAEYLIHSFSIGYIGA